VRTLTLTQVRTLKLLHVSLDAAEAVQPCLETEALTLTHPPSPNPSPHPKQVQPCLETEAAQQHMQQLIDLLFRFRWCWRPEEMLEPRNTSVPGQPVDVCVWGVEHIVGPPSCTRQREPATCGTAR
jgi:hypothetical protein